MVTDKKAIRALRGPGLAEIILGIVISLAVGILLGVAYLLTKPTVIVKELPPPGDHSIYRPVYLVEGSTDTDKSLQWKRKRQMLVEGQPGEIDLTEEEINAFLAASLSVVPPAGPAPNAAPAQVNVRIRDGVFQVAMPTTLNLLGISFAVDLQLRGSFVQGADGYTFAPAELYVGSLPVHRLPGVTGWLMRRMLSAQPPPQELAAAWQKVSSVALAGKTLKLVLP